MLRFYPNAFSKLGSFSYTRTKPIVFFMSTTFGWQYPSEYILLCQLLLADSIPRSICYYVNYCWLTASLGVYVIMSTTVGWQYPSEYILLCQLLLADSIPRSIYYYVNYCWLTVSLGVYIIIDQLAATQQQLMLIIYAGIKKYELISLTWSRMYTITSIMEVIILTSSYSNNLRSIDYFDIV